MTTGPIKIFYLYKKAIFPHCTINIRMRRSRHSVNIKTGDRIIVCSLRSMADILFLRRRISVLSEITEASPDGRHIKFQLKGIKRVRINNVRMFHEGECEEIPESSPQQDPLLTKELRKKAQELIFLINVNESDKLIELMNFLVDLGQISDFIANYFVLEYRMRIELLNETDVNKRSRLLLEKIQQIIDKIKNRG